MAEHSLEDVAKWMLTRIRDQGYLEQAEAAEEIANRFGTDFVYENERGNLAIDRKVLAAFRRQSEQLVVWENAGRLWRMREANDNPGRCQE